MWRILSAKLHAAQLTCFTVSSSERVLSAKLHAAQLTCFTVGASEAGWTGADVVRTSRTADSVVLARIGTAVCWAKRETGKSTAKKGKEKIQVNNVCVRVRACVRACVCVCVAPGQPGA